MHSQNLYYFLYVELNSIHFKVHLLKASSDQRLSSPEKKKSTAQVSYIVGQMACVLRYQTFKEEREREKIQYIFLFVTCTIIQSITSSEMWT